MPVPAFRGDPYAVLGVDAGATDAQIKRRWRDLAREHHPDRAADQADRNRQTRRMARINSAYDLLRDPIRRARYDASPSAERARASASPARFEDDLGPPAGGPPPAPRTRPVTARFDTSAVFHGRNTTTSRGAPPLRGHDPIGRARSGGPDLRASTPTGPIEKRPSGPAPRMPSLDDASARVLEFGKFRGMTLGEVARLEPTYLDWIARTITRDRDLVANARVVCAELDRQGVERTVRPPRPGWGRPTEEPEAAAAG